MNSSIWKEISPLLCLAAASACQSGSEPAINSRAAVQSEPLRVQQWWLDQINIDAAHQRASGHSVLVAVLNNGMLGVAPAAGLLSEGIFQNGQHKNFDVSEGPRCAVDQGARFPVERQPIPETRSASKRERTWAPVYSHGIVDAVKATTWAAQPCRST